MRWYTRAWQRGDEPAIDPNDAYASYVRSIATQLPAHVGDFAVPAQRHLAVDDAKVDRADLDSKARTLRLRLLNGDLQAGYGKLTLDFAGVTIVEPALAEASALLADPSTEFLVHEVEVLGPGRYEVRFLLYPVGELHVQCDDVRATWAASLDGTRTDYRSEVSGFDGRHSSDIRRR